MTILQDPRDTQGKGTREMTIPRNNIDTGTILDIQRIADGKVECDFGNGVTGLVVGIKGSTAPWIMYDVIWWIDGVRHREDICHAELFTETNRYLQNTTDHDPLK